MKHVHNLSLRALFAKQSPHGTGGCFVAATLLLAMTLVAGACLPVESVPPTATPAPTETTVPTATIVWFPPSATPTLAGFSTSTPTAEMNPGLGDVIVTDDFSDESLWDTAVSDQGSATIGADRLALAVQPGVYLASMRRDLTLSNFHAEITVRLSLCRGEDSYGIIIRSSGTSFYRFILSCNGQMRAERILGGIRLPIQDPIPSGDAPGAPGEVRIGIWASGGEMRLFLNDRYQFSVFEKSIPSGAFGVFARSAGSNPVSVTFSDLKVYEVDYAAPTATPNP